VSEPLGAAPLSATRHYVLVLRLALGPAHREAYGKVIDPETRRSQPFVGLAELCSVVGAWLRETERRMDITDTRSHEPGE